MIRKIFRWVGSLVLEGFFLILLLSLISYLKPEERSGEALSFPTPSPTPFVSPWEGATLDQIHFGEPKVVLTDALGLRIVGWISNDEVLIRRDTKPGGRGSAIEVFNVETKEVRRLAEGWIWGKPIWSFQERAVAYLLYDEGQKKTSLFWQALDGQPIKLLEGAAQPIVLSPDGHGAMAYSRARGDLMGKAFTPIEREVKLEFAQYAPPAPGCGWKYDTAVSPDGEWQVVYNCEHFLLIDTKEGVIREIDLGTERPGGEGFPRGALDAQWSPDGQQLAIVSTFGDFLPRPTQLLILDPWGEKVHEIRRPPGAIFSEVDWAPKGKVLLVSGLEVISEGTFLPRMWLVDVKMESMRDLASFPVARSEDPRGGAAWSPDGKRIIFYCRPKSASGSALCLTFVEVGR